MLTNSVAPSMETSRSGRCLETARQNVRECCLGSLTLPQSLSQLLVLLPLPTDASQNKNTLLLPWPGGSIA